MRTGSEHKAGSLTPAQCFQKASELISDKGICLFLIDLKHQEDVDKRMDDLAVLISFAAEVTRVFSTELPENKLAVSGRIEKGFQHGLGDAFWAGISDPETINRILEFKDTHYPDLPLHYGVTADGWSDGIELVK